MLDADQDWRTRARDLVETLAEGGLADRAVLEAMANVPRHLFVADELRDHAYEDRALAIGADQTISQPFVVGYMASALRIRPGARVLEVGTGSGYEAAVLDEMGAEVYSIEILPELSARAAAVLAETGHARVSLDVRDGAQGWPRHAPYDGIVVSAAAPDVPQALVDQLVDGGVLMVPLGEKDSLQWLWRLTKHAGAEPEREALLAVRFVAMTGRSTWH